MLINKKHQVAPDLIWIKDLNYYKKLYNEQVYMISSGSASTFCI